MPARRLRLAVDPRALASALAGLMRQRGAVAQA